MRAREMTSSIALVPNDSLLKSCAQTRSSTLQAPRMRMTLPSSNLVMIASTSLVSNNVHPGWEAVWIVRGGTDIDDVIDDCVSDRAPAPYWTGPGYC
jgi:hypothetical protein